MKYRRFSRQREQSDDVETNRYWFAGDNHLRHLLEASERLEIPGVRSGVSTAEAIVGRPLTPMSYAGVARRTARRCAAGIYYC